LYTTGVAQRAIREFDAKRLLGIAGRRILVGPGTVLQPMAGKLVVKPDELVGKRGKQGLVKIGNWQAIEAYLKEHRGKEVEISGVRDVLEYFLIEPYVEHEQEWFVAIRTVKEGDEILWSKKGGIDVERRQVESIMIPLGEEYNGQWRELYQKFVTLDFASLEINPLAKVGNKFIPLDVKARLDDAAKFWHLDDWGEIEFPTPWGRKQLPEEKLIQELDEKSGASLKLMVLQPRGRIWLLVAGGAGSVVYADTVADLGQAEVLANYGEYSGNPSAEEMYQYTKAVMGVMLREGKKVKAKKLLIGGAVANFTDVAATFKGMVRALNEVSGELRDQGIEILVRRGGPNYQEGLAMMKKFGEENKLPVQVYGPETAMTKIVELCLQ
jgi:ATP-citrate lyase beta-subunit